MNARNLAGRGPGSTGPNKKAAVQPAASETTIPPQSNLLLNWRKIPSGCKTHPWSLDRDCDCCRAISASRFESDRKKLGRRESSGAVWSKNARCRSIKQALERYMKGPTSKPHWLESERLAAASEVVP
jgi:hypothetical protein